MNDLDQITRQFDAINSKDKPAEIEGGGMESRKPHRLQVAWRKKKKKKRSEGLGERRGRGKGYEDVQKCSRLAEPCVEKGYPEESRS